MVAFNQLIFYFFTLHSPLFRFSFQEVHDNIAIFLFKGYALPLLLFFSSLVRLENNWLTSTSIVAMNILKEIGFSKEASLI